MGEAENDVRGLMTEQLEVRGMLWGSGWLGEVLFVGGGAGERQFVRRDGRGSGETLWGLAGAGGGWWGLLGAMEARGVARVPC